MLSDRVNPSLPRSRALMCGERGVARVALHGEIDHERCVEVGAHLAGFIARHRRVLVDLRDVTFIDAGGIRACLTAQAAARARGGDLWFYNPQRLVARVIEILGLETTLLGDSRG